MQPFQDLFVQAVSWFKFFKAPDWIIPIAGAIAASTYFSWKLKKMKAELIDDLNEALGSFRIELRKLTQGARDSLIDGAKKARNAVEATPSEQDKKLQNANRVAIAAQEVAKQATLQASELTSDQEGDERRNWGEIQLDGPRFGSGSRICGMKQSRARPAAQKGI